MSAKTAENPETAEAAKTKKNLLLHKLRLQGNHIHNIKFLKEGKGVLKMVKQTKGSTYEDYTSCPRCEGYYAKKNFRNHPTACPRKNQENQGQFPSSDRSKSIPEPLTDGVCSSITPEPSEDEEDDL